MGSRTGIADSKERMDLAPGDVLLTVMSLSSPKVPRRRCINLLLPTPPYWKFYRTLHSFCPWSALCTPAYTSGDVTYGEEDSPAERRESIVAASVLSRLASFRFPLKTFLLGNRLNANCPNNSLPVISWKFSTNTRRNLEEGKIRWTKKEFTVTRVCQCSGYFGYKSKRVLVSR